MIFVEKPGIKTIIKVMAVVGDFVGKVGDLGFEGGGFGVEIGTFARMIVGRVMLHQTFANFPGKVQPWKMGIFLFEIFNDAETLFVVLKAAIFLHQSVKHSLSAVSERRMTEVVRERDCLR